MIEDNFAPSKPISLSHAARTAARLAQLREAPPRRDSFLRRLEGRLWQLLDLNAEARQAFQCPPDRTLAEHAANMTDAQLADAAEHLAAIANGTPPGSNA